MQKRNRENHFLAHDNDEHIIAEFTSYLAVSLKNARAKYLKNWWKIRHFECSIEDLDPDFEPIDRGMEEKIEEMLAWQTVKDYLPKLSPKECEVILCLYVKRLSTAQTAKQMNLTAETIRWHKSNALRKIRESMEEIE